MSVAFSFEDTLRKHDLAILNWLETLTVNYDNIAGTPRNGVPVLSVMATPSRPFAYIPDLLVSRGWISGATAEEMKEKAEENWDVLPLPLCTIVRGEPAIDYEQAGPPKVYRTRFIDPVTQKWVQHPWPGSYRVDYSITFWSQKRYTEAHMREWLYAQLGRIGAAPSELFIPVHHDEPWGVIPQSLKFLGSADLSDLEGEEQRLIRFEVQLSLRMMFMFKPLPTPADEGHPLLAIQGTVCYPAPACKPMPGVPLGLLVGGFQQSANLFATILPEEYWPLHWPKTGAATVAPSPVGPACKPDGLLLTLKDPVDSVELLERPVPLDGQGQAIVQVSFSYISDAPVSLEVLQRNPTTDVLTLANERTLPPSAEWREVSFFAVVESPLASVALTGLGTLATVYIGGVDVRHIYTQPLMSFTEQAVVGPDVEYRWSGLPSAPLLVRVTINSTPGPTSLTIQNDILVPDVSDVVSIDSTVNVGFAYLIQPKIDSLALRVSALVALASVALHQYGGHYHPNEV
jgi:hypothetical protein